MKVKFAVPWRVLGVFADKPRWFQIELKQGATEEFVSFLCVLQSLLNGAGGGEVQLLNFSC